VFAINRARVGVAVLVSLKRFAWLAAKCNVGDDGSRAAVGATTTHLGAGGEGSPARENTVNGTGLLVACLVVYIVGTLVAAVREVGHDRTSLLLGSSSTRSRAFTPSRPLRHNTVDGAGEGVASGRGSERRALYATELDVSGDGARLGLGTSTARLRASAVARPGRNLAVNWASLDVADTVFSQRTSITTVFGSDINLVVARLGAGATSLGAGGPGVPRMRAVNGARVSVAVLLSRNCIASLASVGDVGDDGLGTSLDTATAEFSAGTPVGPVGEDAINWAGVVVAISGLAVFATLNTTVAGNGNHRFGGELRSSTTALGASAPSSPARQNTVNGTSLGGAGSGLENAAANDTTMGNVSDDGLGLGLGTIAAGLGASTPSRPARKGTVHGASENVARGGGTKGRAYNTAKSYVGNYRTRFGLGASAARLGASTIVRPARNLAVDGTGLGVASALLNVRAGVAFILGRGDNPEVTGLITSTAGLGAGGPCVPLVHAVNCAGASVAVTLFLKSGADGTAVLGSGGDGARALLDAAVAGYRALGVSTERTDYTVYRATESVARFDVADSTAVLAAETGGDDGGLGTSLGTGFARLRASRESRPLRKLAIDGTFLGVASALFAFGTTIATMASSGVHNIRADLFTGTTGLRAGAPAVPGMHTVNGTGVSVAILRSFKHRAGNTVVLGFGHDGASTGLYTTSALFAARAPGTPGTDVAVDRTGSGVACTRFGQGRTYDTAVLYVLDDAASLGLRTSAASLGAKAVRVPAADTAVHRAALGVANALLGKRACFTTVGGLDEGVEFSHLSALVTRFGASTPSKPGVLARDRAGVDVAVGLFDEGIAFSTTMSRRNQNPACALLHATAALFRASLPAGPCGKLAINRLGGRGVSGSHGWLIGFSSNVASIPASGERKRDGWGVLVVAQAVSLSTGELLREISSIKVEGMELGFDSLGIRFINGTKVHGYGNATVHKLLGILLNLIPGRPGKHVLLDTEFGSKNGAKSVLFIPVKRSLRALG